MIHPATRLAFISPALGHGVFATAAIPRGTITWVRDALDQTIPRGRALALPAALREVLADHAYFELGGDYVLCWDHTRFMNHSCAPNVRGPGFDCEVAVRDIAAGEQLVGNYSTMGITRSLRCQCGAPDCRGVVRPDDARRHGAAWDLEVRAAVSLVPGVVQPLWDLLRYPDDLSRAARDPAQLPSCVGFHDGEPSHPDEIVDRALWRL